MYMKWIEVERAPGKHSGYGSFCLDTSRAKVDGRSKSCFRFNINSDAQSSLVRTIVEILNIQF